MVRTGGKKRGRLDIIAHLLGSVRYERPVRRRVTLPRRQKAAGCQEPAMATAPYPHTVLTAVFSSATDEPHRSRHPPAWLHL